METTLEEMIALANERGLEEERLVDELASLSAHLNAATARWLERVWAFHEEKISDDLAGFLAYRCGMTRREAREFLRVAEALQELPRTRAAFSRGELSFTKVRALTRVANGSTEEGLLEIAEALTASELERALRVYRQVVAAEAHKTHELEFVDYYFDEDGSLYLRARLAAEDGTLLVKALEAARERVAERRRHERVAAGQTPYELPVPGVEPSRPARVEALVELAQGSPAGAEIEHPSERARLIVHVDAGSLASDARGRSELEDGPVISPETVRRLGCDADMVAQLERDRLPVSVGRSRRTVPRALRRLLEAGSDTCCFPGCERRRHLQAHHRRHWAHGGETSLENLVLLCFHHHRFVHEGGYTIEDDPEGGLRFRNRYGVLAPSLPPRAPPGSADELFSEHDRLGLEIGPRTNRNGGSSPFDLGASVSAISAVAGLTGNTY